MYSLIRPLLFRMDPEASHDLVLGALAIASRHRVLGNTLHSLYGNKVPALPTRVMGLDFGNPLGLAAGLDKQGNCAAAFAALGFGFVELGTVTPLPQSGNAKPRMFRLASHHAIINRMGFNSIGLDAFLQNLTVNRGDVILGINIGKNAATSMQHAVDDYLQCLAAVYHRADYITINISSPNTSNLRSLQHDEALDSLLGSIRSKALELAEQRGKYVPLVLKVAPDISRDQVDTIARLLRQHHIDGIAATNTTISREAIKAHPHADQAGGLSGRPLRQPATDIVRAFHQQLQGEIPVIGIGGIDDIDSALEKLQSGASLLQLYTGLIYQGPGLVRHIVQGLAAKSAQYPFADWLEQLQQG